MTRYYRRDFDPPGIVIHHAVEFTDGAFYVHSYGDGEHVGFTICTRVEMHGNITELTKEEFNVDLEEIKASRVKTGGWNLG